MHDIRLELIFLADKQEWRLYSKSGQYWSAKNIEAIPNALKNFLRSDAKHTLEIISEEPLNA